MATNKRLGRCGYEEMTVDDAIRELPNGLHDAELRKFTMDYSTRQLTLDLDIWIADLHGKDAQRELYRSALLTFDGVGLFVSEPTSDILDQDGSVRIDFGKGRPATASSILPQTAGEIF